MNNKFPLTTSNKRIAIIIDFPNKNEEDTGEILTGPAGRVYCDLLAKAGLTREQCFLGSICATRPLGGDISMITWDSLSLQTSIAQLRSDLEQFRPNVILLIGKLALRMSKDMSPLKTLNPKSYKHKIDSWRGSLFRCEETQSPFYSFKCIAAYDHMYLCKDFSVSQLIIMDARKAVRESTSNELKYTKREINVCYDFVSAMLAMRTVRLQQSAIGCDIEGYIWAMSCISFTNDKGMAYVIPFFRKDRKDLWTVEQELKLYLELCLLMMDTAVPKIWQNGLYDRFVLQYSYHIPVLGNLDDIMLKWWEFFSEFEKKLAMQVSVLTNEPFYKSEGKSGDDDTFFNYGGKDAACTLECNEVMEGWINTPERATSLVHYRLNHELLNPLLYMELNGIAYDSEGAVVRRKLLLEKMFEVQAKLNAITGRCFNWESVESIVARAEAIMLTKKKDRPRKEYINDYVRFRECLKIPISLSLIGEIENLCEVSNNVSSPKFITFLYDELKLPIQLSADKHNPVPTANYEALINLKKIIKDEPAKYTDSNTTLEILDLAIEIRSLATRSQMLSITADPDGRIRCGYNIVGSDTGRISCYESPTGSGYNLQTIPKYEKEKDAPGGIIGDRDLFKADPDHWLFQCDLKGADGWTVAAYSAMLGDRTMLEDFNFGLKPALILVLMLRGVKVDFSDREAIKYESKKIPSSDWDYFAMKSVIHGSSYLEGDNTISRSIHIKSDGKFYLPPKECGKLKKVLFTRYRGIQLYQNYAISQMAKAPIWHCASGQIRRFFGRRDEIITKAVAAEPQANTTYATNLAMRNLWNDPENRYIQDGKTFLHVRPSHQVHDALVGQFRKDQTEWACEKIRQWFKNPITIAGQLITIPFDGAYGPDWLVELSAVGKI